MIVGYILETNHGLLIHNKFFNVKPSIDTHLVASAFNSICLFTKEILDEPVEEILTNKNRIVVAHNGNVMLSIISRTTNAMARQLAKKFVKIFSEKLQTEDKCIIVCDALLDKIKNELDELEREIVEINKNYQHQSYV
ncbi:MAG: hypothetical protein KIH08_15470 [Candidatus Freyarchaeota archaeon]|nr:hypothetical protein [Candidatus Jordarchaeia archaeon]MBS7267619.1 hypothetical protein [Candidatus Jordarchaeia archaeon]MBS7278826.1 hypothetical protein [Candidatus Jordarchaeia archaeon]